MSDWIDIRPVKISQVIKAHTSNYPNPIAFKTKERLRLGKEDVEYPGWIWVTVTDGNSGWAPLQYIETQSIEHQGSSGQGIARCDYCARELDVAVGEQLQLACLVNGWYYGTNAQGETGWVPEHCVALLE